MASSKPIDPVAPSDLPSGLAEALRPRIERLGYLGGFFTCAAHQPDALLGFIQFTEHLKHALAPNHTEVVALTVATLMGNDYERHQHERLSVALGFAPEWVRDIEELAPKTSSLVTPDERMIQELVLELIELQGHVPAEQVRALKTEIGEAECVGVLMLVGRYVAHAIMANAFGVEPPVPSIFQTESSDG